MSSNSETPQPKQQEMTSISLSTGREGLIQLGVSLADISLLVEWGKKFGIFFQAARNDEDLFQALNEHQDALLKRRGLIELVRMKSKWSRLEVIYEGERKGGGRKAAKDAQELTAFAWLMVAVVAGLDLCCRDQIQGLLIRVMVIALDRDDAAEVKQSLRVMLSTNIESWRSFGRVTKMHTCIANTCAKIRRTYVQGEAIPQLNQAELEDMERFLVWLMKGESNNFRMVSLDVYSFSAGIQAAGVLIRTKGNPSYESEPVVEYRNEGAPSQINWHHLRAYDDPLRLQREATKKFHLVAEAGLPFTESSEVFYRLEGRDYVNKRYDTALRNLVDHAFPAASGSLLKALEKLTQGMDSTRKQWLHMYTGDEFLQCSDATLPYRCQENMEPWLKYQSLVFGFYYQLFQPLLKFSVDKDTYFQGLWGYGSTTFLAMCSNFGQSLRSGKNRVSRSHLLFMLATMLNGRQKRFNSGFASHGLLGILGPISILSMPLMCEVDRPEQIAQFMVVDLPIIDLAAGADGEVYASPGTGTSFDAQPVMSREITPHAPTKLWSIHAKMGVSFEGGQSGVVMAAKCSGRLVGWFNPMAADVMFLSTAYLTQHEGQDLDKEASIPGFEITDEDWQKGCIPRPIQENVTNSFGVVHSCNCPALRYAATGFFATAGEEIVIPTGDISAAFGRIEAQESGIIVA